MLPLDDCLYSLQATVLHLMRSSLCSCPQLHGISRLPEVAGDKPVRKKFKPYVFPWIRTIWHAAADLIERQDTVPRQ